MSKARYYRRDGKPILNLFTWARLLENRTYSRVAETILDDGTRISTVWLGLDHSFSPDAPPLIFETMVFSPETKESPLFPGQEFHEDWEMDRYSTEAEAIIGHDAMVRKWKAIREKWKNVEVGPEEKGEVRRWKQDKHF